MYVNYYSIKGVTMAKTSKMNRQRCMDFATRILECFDDLHHDQISAAFNRAASIAHKEAKRIGGIRKRGTWGYFLKSLAEGFKHYRQFETEYKRFSIFTTGNSKLPFKNFSTLPLFTCPGYGECGEWCYSLKAWRYPSAFCRQVLNTVLIKYNRGAIRRAFMALPRDITLRLYVDGDFDSHKTMALWFNLLHERADIAAYGYSKSWRLLATYDDSIHMNPKFGATTPMPRNYMLNMSSGSRYDTPSHDHDQLRMKVSQLPITRGVFGAVQLENEYKDNSRYDDKQYHKEVRDIGRAEYGNRVFSCTGNCGACLPSGEHACGSERMNDVPILIGIH